LFEGERFTDDQKAQAFLSEAEKLLAGEEQRKSWMLLERAAKSVPFVLAASMERTFSAVS